MTELLMQALIVILAADVTVQGLVADRIEWDSEETDPALPSVTLRDLATTIPARDLVSRGGIRRSLVEVSANARTLLGSVQLMDACLAALNPYEAGPASVIVASGTAQLASINLDDVTQSTPVRAQSYRQTATLIVAFYE